MPSGGDIFRCTFLPAALLFQRPSGTPSFAARRKIEEKGVPRRRKLHILRFALRGKSSVVPLLLLSPPNPLRWALAGAPVPKPPFGFWLFIRGFGGETCVPYYEFALVQLTRFRPVSSSQAPHPSFCLSGQKLSRSAAPPFPTKPTSLGFGGGPFLHCFHGLMRTAPTAVNSLALRE